MMRKIFLMLSIILLAIPFSFAGDIGTVNEQMTLWADALTGTGYYSGLTANITVRNSTGSVVVDNQSMIQVATGLFAYNFTPSTTGQFYTNTIYANNTALVGIATSTFYIQDAQLVKDTNMTGLITIIALGLIAIILLILAFKVDGEYAWMKNILLVFSFMMIVGMSATALLNKDACGLVSNNGALVKQCVTTTTLTSVEWWLFLISITLLAIVIAAIIVGLFIKAVQSFMNSGQKLQ